MRKNQFTLIELIIAIVVIGILSAIVSTEMNVWKDKAKIAAISSNEKSIQTALDMYQLNNFGEKPSEIQPTKEIPRFLNFESLTPDYLKKKPKSLLTHYWVDYQGKYWQSTLDSPRNVLNTNGTITWDFVPNANKYIVYLVRNARTESFETTTTNYFNANHQFGDTYLVSAVDNFGYQSAPVGEGYHGFEPTYALKLNGINQFVKIPNSPVYQFGTNDFSYSLKFKVDQIPTSSFYQLFEKRVSSGANFEVQVNPEGRIYSYLHNSTPIISAPIVKPNQIYEVTIVRKAGTAYVYLDGVLIAQGNGNFNVNNSNDLHVGVDSVIYGEFTRGAVFSIKLWNKALNNIDVQGLKDREFTGKEQGLVGYWKLSEGQGSTIQDYSPTQNHGIIINNAVWEMQ